MKRILLIEDDPSIRRNVQLLLSVEGYDVQVAENGQEGLQLALSLLPDLVISDIMMPGLDGHQVLQALRANPASAGIPLIFLSAKADRSDRRQGLELGADDYLTKPFSRQDLLHSISIHLSRDPAL